MALNTAESLAEKQRGIKVGSRVCALQSGKYTLERGTVTADEGMSWRIKFDRYDEISVPKRKVVRVDNSVVSCNKQHYVWFAPWSTPASKAMDDIEKKVRGAKSEGANILLVKDEAMAKRVYDLARKARVPAKDVKIGYNSYSCSRNAVVAKALNACGTARNAWGDETQVNGLITKMLGLINKIKPIAQQLYDTAFDLDDAGSVWLGRNNGSKNAQKVKIAVERANKIMKRLSNFTSGLD